MKLIVIFYIAISVLASFLAIEKVSKTKVPKAKVVTLFKNKKRK